MKNISGIKHIILGVSLLFVLTVSAQEFTAGDNITLQISEYALIETNHAPVSLTLNTTTAGEAAGSVSNSDVFIRISSITPGVTDREITARISSGSVPAATYLTLVATGIDINSDYRFEVSFSISHDATNSNAVVDIKDFGVSLLPQVYTVEPKDNSDRKWITIAGRITPNPLGAGQIQLQLDFGTDDVADDSTMYFANISLLKIN